MKTKKSRTGGTAPGSLVCAGALAAVVGLSLAGCASFQSIEIIRPPHRTVYGQGQDFDRTGMEVGGITKKGELKPAPDSRVQVSGYDRDKPGIQTLSVVYRNTRTTLQVELVPVRSISIEGAPSLVKQYEDIPGLRARVNYGGRVPPAVVEAGALTLSGHHRDTAGRQTVTAAYYGKTAVFDITVVEMSRLVINTPPRKVVYLLGEELNLEGLRATGTWEGLGDGPVTPRYVSGFNPAVKGVQTVIVEAQGRQGSFTVTVKEPVDPTAWTPVMGGFAKNLTGIVYGQGMFVAAGYDDDKPHESIIAYSPDGIVWTEWNTGVDYRITGVFFVGGKFLFTGFNMQGQPVIRGSSNGIKMDLNQYVYFTGFALGASRCTGIAHGGGMWVAVFDRGRAAYSADGREWSDIFDFIDDTTWDGNTGVFFDGTHFIALEASGAYRISRSAARGIVNNTANWERRGTALIRGRPITGMVFGGGKWVGIGPDNTAGWSADGITWTAADNIGGAGERLRRGDLTGAAYGAGRFVAVNNRGNIIYSRDGYNWTLVFSSTFGSTGIRAVAYGDGKFVAVGDNGRIAYSRVLE
ncbi:MAG: bacterial Ig-like domain-containing protein [Spirochaetaceae bacterium]|nr:bacterial Ig-like domain-containing protein [Spirochaetaceae bacterium]